MQKIIVSFLSLVVFGCTWTPVSGRAVGVGIVPTRQGLGVNAGGALDFAVG